MGCCLPATAAAVTIAAALATTFLSWARLIHSKGTSTHLQVIKGFNRGVSRVIFPSLQNRNREIGRFPDR